MVNNIIYCGCSGFKIGGKKMSDLQPVRRHNISEPLVEKIAVPLVWLGIGYLLGRVNAKKKAGAE